MARQSLKFMDISFTYEDLNIFFLSLFVMANADEKFLSIENEYIENKFALLESSTQKQVRSFLDEEGKCLKTATSKILSYLSASENKPFDKLLIRSLYELACVDNEYVEVEDSLLNQIKESCLRIIAEDDFLEIANKYIEKVRDGIGFVDSQFPEIKEYVDTYPEFFEKHANRIYIHDSNLLSLKTAGKLDAYSALKSLWEETRFRYSGEINISIEDFQILKQYYYSGNRLLRPLVNGINPAGAKALIFFLFICELTYWEYGKGNVYFWDNFRKVFGDDFESVNNCSQSQIGNLLSETAKAIGFEWEDHDGAGKYVSQVLRQAGVPRELLKNLIKELDVLSSNYESFSYLTDEDLIQKFRNSTIRRYLSDSGEIRALLTSYVEYMDTSNFDALLNTVLGRKGSQVLNDITLEMQNSVRRDRESRDEGERIVLSFDSGIIGKHYKGQFKPIDSPVDIFNEEIEFALFTKGKKFAEFQFSSKDKDFEIDFDSFYIVIKDGVTPNDDFGILWQQAVNWVGYSILYIQTNKSDFTISGAKKYEISFLDKNNRLKFFGLIPYEKRNKVDCFSKIPIIKAFNIKISNILLNNSPIEPKEFFEKSEILISPDIIPSEPITISVMSDMGNIKGIVSKPIIINNKLNISTNASSIDNPVSIKDLQFSVEASDVPYLPIYFWAYQSNLYFRYMLNGFGCFDINADLLEKINWKNILSTSKFSEKEAVRIYYQISSETGAIYVHL